MRNITIGWMFVAAGVVLAGCIAATPHNAAEPAEPESPSNRSSLELPARGAEAETPGSAPAGQPLTGKGVPEELLAAVRADASQRSGRTPEALKLVRADRVTWRDGALGCPSPGAHYIQVLTDGYWIVFEVDGRQYDYRATSQGQFRLCEAPARGGGESANPTK